MCTESFRYFIDSPTVFIDIKHNNCVQLQRQADSYSPEELGLMLAKYSIKSPVNGTNDLTTPFPFNLMFR